MNNIAKKYPFTTDRVITNPYEGLVYGNGDLAANATIYSHQLTIELGKNDIWDSRVEGYTKDFVLKHDDLIGYEKEYGFEWPEDCSVLPQTVADWPGRPENLDILYCTPSEEKVIDDNIILDFGGATPKKAGAIHILHPGISDTQIKGKLDISNGVLNVVYSFRSGKLHITSFVHKIKNIVLMKLTVEGKVPWVRVHVEKQPDYADSEMPLPVVKTLGKSAGYITQTIPRKFDVDDFSWCLNARFPSNNQAKGCTPVIKLAHAIRQDLHLKDGDTVYLGVSIATDRDSQEDPVKNAIDMIQEVTEEIYHKEYEKHTNCWNDFWSNSSIELEDKELESVWYRSVYGFACHMKPGAQAPSLCANIPVTDHAVFHGRYTWNHNVQKWYVPSLPVNHLEWYDVFAELINQSIPTFEYLAKEIFGLEGVYCDLATIPFAPPHRTPVYNKWGRALCMTGWLAHMLWQHWEYTCDNKWLKDNAYNYIKKAAQFYDGYLKKYQNEDGEIYPSMRLEEPGWCKDFVGNCNIATDLVMFRNCLKSAIYASEVLDIDKEEREEWKKAFKRIPEIDYGWTEDGQGWYAICKDWDKVDSVIAGRRISEFADMDWRLNEARTARWGGGGWILYPGEYIQGDENEGIANVIRDMLKRVDIMDPPNTICKFHAISSIIPHIRLGIFENFDKIRQLLLYHRYNSGQFSSYSTGEGELIRGAGNFTWRIVENQYLGILGIAEMMLQSQGNVIRLFPFWKGNISAKFTDLRARGGFLVSSEWKPGIGINNVLIKSTVGGLCRIRWTNDSTPTIHDGDREVSFQLSGNDIVFYTKKGKEYKITI